MKTFIIPALIQAKLKQNSIEDVAKELGYSIEVIQACVDQFDKTCQKGLPISDLKLGGKKTKDIPDLAGTHTIKDMADITGVSERTVSRHIKKYGLQSAGTSARPSISELFEHRTLADIARFLKIDIERLKLILK